MKNSSRRKAKVICFSGIDGAGKTTLAKYLVEMMNKRGNHYKYVYGRLEPLILSPFITIGGKIFFREKDMFRDYTKYSITKREVIEHNSFLFTLYKNILLFDYFLQILFKIRVPLIIGKSVVCDRYVYDTVINDLSVDMNYSKSEIKNLLKKCFFVAPKPNLVFLIDIPEEVAFQRKKDIPSVDYLKERRVIYLDIGKEERMIVLDGSKDLAELKNLVRDKVFEFINKGDKL